MWSRKLVNLMREEREKSEMADLPWEYRLVWLHFSLSLSLSERSWFEIEFIDLIRAN